MTRAEQVEGLTWREVGERMGCSRVSQELIDYAK